MNNIDVKIVDKACELIKTGWSKHTNARDKYRNSVPYYNVAWALLVSVE